MYPRAARRDGEVIFVKFRTWECWIDFSGRYAPQNNQEHGGWVLRLRMKEPPVDDTDLVATATVHVDLGDDFETAEWLSSGTFVLIKDWAENAGVLAALIAGGVVEDTNERISTGYEDAALCHLLVQIPSDAERPAKAGAGGALDAERVRVFEVDGDFFMALDESGAIEAHYGKYGAQAYDVLVVEDLSVKPEGSDLTWRDLILQAIGQGQQVPSWIFSITAN